MQQIDHARAVLEELPKLSVDIQAVTQQLEQEGVAKFIQPFDKLLQAVQSKQASARSGSGPSAASRQRQTQR